MPAADSPSHNIPSDDDLDALLNDVLHEDISKIGDTQTQDRPSKPSSKVTNPADLGIDEEIKTTKQRRPIPKLDANRILSERGIPKLRKIAKERLKFKGKGHEYGDVARMLNMYQLWLDDLYPRAKFADGLTIIEKLGHTKQMQVMRKGWIDEGKPRHTADDDEDEVVQGEPDEGVQTHAQETEDVEMAGMSDNRNEQSENKSVGQVTTGETTVVPADEDPDEDELDALLAEADGQAPVVSGPIPQKSTTYADADDPFADEMEAMAEMTGIEW